MTTFCNICGMETMTYTFIRGYLICKNCWKEKRDKDDQLSDILVKSNPILDKMVIK